MKVEGRPGTPTMMFFSIPEVGVEVLGTGLMHDGVHGGEGCTSAPASLTLLGLLLHHLFVLQDWGSGCGS